MRVFFEVDTQVDFMMSAGALYVPGAEALIPVITQLTELANKYSIQILGSMDRHYGDEEHKSTEGELSRWGGPFPDHCMDETEGQEHVLSEDVLARTIMYVPFDGIDDDNDNDRDIEGISILTRGRPTYFEKQTYDVFTNPYLVSTLKRLDVTEAIVYGVATDFCVKAAVRGLRKLAISTLFVVDAIAAVTPEGGEEAARQMIRMGAMPISSSAVMDAMKAIYE